MRSVTNHLDAVAMQALHDARDVTLGQLLAAAPHYPFLRRSTLADLVPMKSLPPEVAARRILHAHNFGIPLRLLAHELGLRPKAARAVLRQLMDDGLARAAGRGRGTRYFESGGDEQIGR